MKQKKNIKISLCLKIIKKITKKNIKKTGLMNKNKNIENPKNINIIT